MKRLHTSHTEKYSIPKLCIIILKILLYVNGKRILCIKTAKMSITCTHTILCSNTNFIECMCKYHVWDENGGEFHKIKKKFIEVCS